MVKIKTAFYCSVVAVFLFMSFMVGGLITSGLAFAQTIGELQGRAQMINGFTLEQLSNIRVSDL